MNWINSIEKFVPYNEQEKADKKVILKYEKLMDDILKRDNEIMHMTCSGFVINKNRDKVLMVHHNIFNSWSWVGGHADGNENLLEVTLSEIEEETGVKNANPLSEDILSLDIIPVFGHIKNGKYISSHLHLSIAYLIEADEDENLVIKPDENTGVKWIKIDEISNYTNEYHMQVIYNKILDKVKNGFI